MKFLKFLKDHIGVIIVGVCIVVVYTLLTDVFHVMNTFLFYSISVVPEMFSQYIGKLLKGLVSSMSMLLLAYAMSLVGGIVLGTLVGLKKKVRRTVSPYVSAFSAIPVTLLTPYAINIFPSFRVASIFIIFLGCFWIIFGSTINAVMTIDRRYLETAETLELPPVKQLMRVILPAAAPTILSGCQIALKMAFTLLVVAEMFGCTSGLGYFIQYYSDFGRFDVVSVGFIFLAVVLVVLLVVFDAIKAKILHWTLNN